MTGSDILICQGAWTGAGLLSLGFPHPPSLCLRIITFVVPWISGRLTLILYWSLASVTETLATTSPHALSSMRDR